MLQTKIEQQNPYWPYIPDHPYKTLITAGSGSGNTCVIEFNKPSTRY